MSGVVNTIGSLFGGKRSNIEVERVNNKEVETNEESALRSTQDRARRRRGVSANILSTPGTTTAGAVVGKTLTGQ